MKQILVSAFVCATLLVTPAMAGSSKTKMSKSKVVVATTSGSSGTEDPGIVALVGVTVITALVQFSR